jgi:uracil-DNA glycosylase
MDMDEQLGDWYPLLSHVFNEPWMQKLGRRLHAAKWLQPKLEDVFRAFRLCPPEGLKVILISQDPYIRGEADGLAFSSQDRMTPSLQVVFEEINRTHTCKRTVTGLDDWAEQGVLLLNSVLTTEMEKSRAHAGWGWELFTQEVLQVLRMQDRPYVFMTWGKDAQSVMSSFKPRLKYHTNTWKILKAHHPQAQNYNPDNKFVGCNHFIEANLHLIRHDQYPIWWSDSKYAVDQENYRSYCETLLKQIPDVTTYFTKVLRSNTAVPNRSQSFNKGLEPGYAEDLPF